MLSNMVLIFAFISMLVLTTAKPTHEKAGEGKESSSKKVLHGLTQKIVGGCTLKEFTYSTAECKKEFFLSFRKEKSSTCGQRYQIYTKCHVKELRKCAEKRIPFEGPGRALRQYKRRLAEFKKVHCGEADLDMSKYLKGIPEMKDCPKDTTEKLDKCAKKWYQMYKEDKGNLELCNEHRIYTNCAKWVFKRCKFDFTKISWMFNKNLNPFCDKDQIKSQGLD